MTQDKLNYLITLAEERNVTKAAERLFITQPTLTAYVNKVEQQIGFRIFDRSRSPVVLTRSGKTYIEQMRRLIAEEAEMIESIRRQESAQKTICIGIGQVHSQLWMPELVAKLRRAHPDVNVQIREAQELQLMELLRENEIDLLLGHLEIDAMNFSFDVLCEETLSLVIPENLMTEEALRLTEQTKTGSTVDRPVLLQAQMLSGLPLIHPAKMQGLFLNLKQLLDHYHIHPAQTIQTANMITAASLVEKGLGYMYIAPVLLEYTKVKDPLRLYYATLPHLMQTRKFYFGFQKDNPNLTIIEEIREWMREIV